MNKSETRRLIRERKNQMTEQQIHENSYRIIERLCKTREFQSCEHILIYVSMPQEVETRQLIADCITMGKCVYVPKVYGKIMHFHRIQSMNELKPGFYGILEPDNDLIADPGEGLMIMPGLAFDREFHRIGYGGGYYDQYLSEHPALIKAAVCFENQMLDRIETEPHDLKPDLIITEHATYTRHQH